MRYIVIGNGVAGTSAAAKIRALDEAGEIEIFTDEPYPFYSRPMLPDHGHNGKHLWLSGGEAYNMGESTPKPWRNAGLTTRDTV